MSDANFTSEGREARLNLDGAFIFQWASTGHFEQKRLRSIDTNMRFPSATLLNELE